MQTYKNVCVLQLHLITPTITNEIVLSKEVQIWQVCKALFGPAGKCRNYIWLQKASYSMDSHSKLAIHHYFFKANRYKANR